MKCGFATMRISRVLAYIIAKSNVFLEVHKWRREIRLPPRKIRVDASLFDNIIKFDQVWAIRVGGYLADAARDARGALGRGGCGRSPLDPPRPCA